MKLRTILWGAAIIAAAFAGIAIWAAAKRGAESERRLGDKSTTDRKEPRP
jgi:hypothetical protein